MDGSRELGVSVSQLALGAGHCLGLIVRQCTVLTTAIDETRMPYDRWIDISTRVRDMLEYLIDLYS